MKKISVLLLISLSWFNLFAMEKGARKFKKSASYSKVGALPYTRTPEGRIKVLLILDQRGVFVDRFGKRFYEWSIISGQLMNQFNEFESLKATLHDKTRGAFFNIIRDNDFKKFIRINSCTKWESSLFTLFFVEVPYIDASMIRGIRPSGSLQKSIVDFYWVDLEVLLNNRNSFYRTCGHRVVEVLINKEEKIELFEGFYKALENEEVDACLQELSVTGNVRSGFDVIPNFAQDNYQTIRVSKQNFFKDPDAIIDDFFKEQNFCELFYIIYDDEGNIYLTQREQFGKKILWSSNSKFLWAHFFPEKSSFYRISSCLIDHIFQGSFDYSYLDSLEEDVLFIKGHNLSIIVNFLNAKLMGDNLLCNYRVFPVNNFLARKDNVADIRGLEMEVSPFVLKILNNPVFMDLFSKKIVETNASKIKDGIESCSDNLPTHGSPASVSPASDSPLFAGRVSSQEDFEKLMSSFRNMFNK